MANTPHTCGGPTFGRLAARGTCKRCDELRFGAPARRWREGADAQRTREVRAHVCGPTCGLVCTFGQW